MIVRAVEPVQTGRIRVRKAVRPGRGQPAMSFAGCQLSRTSAVSARATTSFRQDAQRMRNNALRSPEPSVMTGETLSHRT